MPRSASPAGGQNSFRRSETEAEGDLADLDMNVLDSVSSQQILHDSASPRCRGLFTLTEPTNGVVGIESGYPISAGYRVS